MKIAVFTRQMHLVLGGMEKQIIRICSDLAYLGHDVTLYTLDQKVPDLFYNHSPLNFRINNISSSDPGIKSSVCGRIRRQYLVVKHLVQNKPDLSISFMYGAFLYSRFSTFVLRVPMIIAERNSPDLYRLTRVRKYRYLIFFTMCFSKKIIVQVPKYKSKYPFFLRKRIEVIPNVVVPSVEIPDKNDNYIRFLFAGRFSHQKQIIKLISAFKLYSHDYPNSTLKIVGAGEIQNQITKKMYELNLQDKISIHEPSSDLTKYFKETDFLCIPSLWEGFPNVLAEALAFGIPAIGFSNCDGVSDLLENNVNGWLIKDDGTPFPLANLLKMCAASKKNGDDLTKNCKHSMSGYSPSFVIKKWNDLINSI